MLFAGPRATPCGIAPRIFCGACYLISLRLSHIYHVFPIRLIPLPLCYNDSGISFSRRARVWLVLWSVFPRR